MKIKRALVVYKKSSYEKNLLESNSRHYRKLLKSRNQSVRDSQALHEEHLASLERVREILRQVGMPYQSCDRQQIRRRRGPIREDLIITVGGDGTFLDASHVAKRQLMLGVNSTPASSIGHFSATDTAGFESLLKKVMLGRARLRRLQRIQASVGKRTMGSPALNDILFASQNPASTSRYWVAQQKGNRLTTSEEEQKSSGIWIATPAGSTAAIHSAGAKPLPLTAERFVYRIRELYREPRRHYRLTGDELGRREVLRLIPKMDDAALFVDGWHLCYPVQRGDVVRIGLSAIPLTVVT